MAIRRLMILLLILLIIVSGCSGSTSQTSNTSNNVKSTFTNEDKEFIDRFTNYANQFNLDFEAYIMAVSAYWNNPTDINEKRLYKAGVKLFDSHFKAKNLKPTEKFAKSFEEFFLEAYSKTAKSTTLMEDLVYYSNQNDQYVNYDAENAERINEIQILNDDAQLLLVQGQNKFNEIFKKYGFEEKVFKDKK